jgi:hypothetical protein
LSTAQRSYQALLLAGLFLLGGCANATHAGAPSSNLSLRASIHSSAPLIEQTLTRKGVLESVAFQQWITLMGQYNGDVSQYLQQYNSDHRALTEARSDRDYQSALATLRRHVDAIKLDALKTEATALARRLNQDATAWGERHTFHDTYNDRTYHLGYEYGPDGVGGWLQDELGSAKTLEDYQQAIEDGNAFLTSFQAYKANTLDKTPWMQAHSTDLQLLQHYNYMQQNVVVVSLSEQVMRVYEHGKLIEAFRVTTGRPEKPSLPGNWSVEEKLSPTVFKSDEPKDSPYWYPDTPITYAMLYHSGGYFIHDSWWRDDYGPDTQFPHVDSSGDSFSFDGSHGCINVSTVDAAWIYHFVDIHTHVVIY